MQKCKPIFEFLPIHASHVSRTCCMSSPHVTHVGLLFHVIVIMQRNSILKNYNNLQDHQTQTNKHIITKRALDYYPCRHGISKTLIPSFFNPRTSSLWDPSTTDSILLSLLYYSPSQGVISVWTLWSFSRILKQWSKSINLTTVILWFIYSRLDQDYL